MKIFGEGSKESKQYILASRLGVTNGDANSFEQGKGELKVLSTRTGRGRNENLKPYHLKSRGYIFRHSQKSSPEVVYRYK